MSDPPRYVVQHHTGREPEHYDLMLQRGDILWTWQLAQPPGATAQEALHIFDHRLDYLTYEGPISGERGHCRIIDSGLLRWLAVADDCVAFELKDGVSAGRYELRLADEAESRWTLTRF
jgi:hypothetical protein